MHDSNPGRGAKDIYSKQLLRLPCAPKRVGGKRVTRVGVSEVVCPRCSLAASGVPARGRAADGSGFQPIPVI